jgi:VWFA-related protein
LPRPPQHCIALAVPLLFILSICVPPFDAARAQETTLRSQANVVLIPVLVKDRDGEIVYGLEAKDFLVADDGVEQAVHVDEAPEGQPVSIAVALQIGRRAAYEFQRIQHIDTMLEPIVDAGHAEVAMIEFDSRVHLMHGFTGDSAQISSDLQQLQPGDGGAAILDAVDESIKLLEKAPQDHQRVLLLISETRDHGSHVKIADAVAEIGKANAVMYALAFSPSLSNILDTGRGNNLGEMGPSPDLIGPMIMAVQAVRKNAPKAMATMTGGEYELFATRNKFEVHMIDFTNHLHSRYLLSISPKNPHPGLHQLRVKLREKKGDVVLARTGYWAEGK